MQAALRRATSTAYYALFHCLAESCADSAVGGMRRGDDAWQHVFRALDHTQARSRCRDKSLVAKFPAPIQDFAEAFANLQSARNNADYNPYVRFLKSDVLIDIIKARNAIEIFPTAPSHDRRAFSALVLLKPRGRA